MRPASSFVSRLAGLRQHGSVTLRKEGRIAWLTLHNQERRNALTGPMMVQLAGAVSELEHWKEGAAVILTGDGGTFCAGLDLSCVRSGVIASPEDGMLMSQYMTETLYRLRQLPLLSVAAVDGYGIGGGAELSTATDWRVMSQGATLRFVHAKMGATTGWGGGARLVSLVGRSTALRLLAHGTALDAAAAAAIGLCDGIGETDETAAAAALRLLVEPALVHSASVESLRAIKAAIAGASNIPEAVRAEETSAVGLVWGSDANRTAVGPGNKRV